MGKLLKHQYNLDMDLNSGWNIDKPYTMVEFSLHWLSK